jgi:SAM-dependent methyltransferase
MSFAKSCMGASVATETVFGSDYAQAYDALYRDKDYRGECDMFEEACRRYGAGTTKTVADFGCGTGSHAIELARRGYHVTGVDRSEDMLLSARAKTDAAQKTAQPLEVRFEQGDVATCHLAESFDAVLMMFAVLGYQFSNDRLAATLENVRRHLRLGGLFVFDVWYGPAVLTEGPSDRVRVIEDGERRILRAAHTDLNHFEHRATVRFRVWTLANKRIASETNEAHEMRYFFPQELFYFLATTRFTVRSISAFPSLVQPLTDRTWNALVVAQSV